MSVTEVRTNFLGIPIEGDINPGAHRVDQRPIEELTPLFQAVLDQEDVFRFGWRQYTPYFNDGEPCVFSTYGLWADPVGSVNDLEEYDDPSENGVEYDDRWGKYPNLGWIGEYPNRRKILGPYERPAQGDRQAAYDALLALNEAIDSGAFDDVLLEKFGDHAMITVYRNRISVEYYEHD
jgi:hypothetical protein